MPRTLNQSLAKAYRLLEALRAQGPLSLTELSALAGMHKSSAFRLLGTLQSFKWVEQDPDKRYRLGLGAVMLGQAALAQRSVVRVALPHMTDLVEKFKESASLVLFQEREAYYVTSVEAPRSMRASPQRPGTTVPLHCSGSGKVLLSCLPESELVELVRRLPLEPRTERTITDAEALLREIAEVRRRGYAVDNQELEAGLLCIAAPLADYTGNALGAISLSGHCVRIEARGVERVAAEVVRTALSISVDLGYVPEEPGVSAQASQ